ncbi:hypothetical protein V1264_020760 [Littorina saxatilis]|uniref:RCC1-like domain-containing protein n=2 Tax=Littorina saxatilis TaxID=31220 RepID=A0AAN9BCI3_9CAEN
MLLHCYVHMVAHQSLNMPHTVTAFREFLLGSFAFDESVALDLLAEYGLTMLLLDFAMARGLVADALGRLVSKGRLPVALTLLTQLVSRGFSAHVLQAAQGGVLSSLMAEAVMQVLVTKPELVTRHITLIKRQITSLDLPLLLQLAAILDPSQGSVRNLVRRQASSLHRAASLTSIASFTSNIGDLADGNQDGVSLLSQALEVFLLTVLHINCHRGNQESLTADLILSDPTQRQDTEGVEEGAEDGGHQSLALQFALSSCGSHHTAVVRDGDLYTWGRTAHGRLGHGDLVREGSVSAPVCVQTFSMLQIRVEAVACGGEHTLAITQQGVYGWGNSRYGQVGVGTRHVYHRPMLLEALLSHTCVALHCGQYHSLAITADCRVWSWGWGVHGQLGHGDPEDQLFPKVIKRMSSKNIVRAAAGYCHSLVLSDMGEVWSFGCGYFGQLGIGGTHKRTSPVLIKSFSEPVSAIGTKYFHSIAVTVSNKVYSWGCHPHNLRYAANSMRRSRQMGQMAAPTGDGMEMFHLPSPVDTTFVHSKVVQVSCGSLHTCLLTIEGEVYVWGRNLEGQLGTGTRQDERVPKMLTRINDQHVIHLSAGGEFNMALDNDLLLWVWGKNDAGQLGLVKSALPGHGHKKGVSQMQSWRQSNLVTSDVVIPTAHRGLPPVNVMGQARWCTGSLQGPTAAVQTTQWVEEGGGGGEDVLIPSLQSVSPSDLPYHSKVIPLVVKYLGDYMDRTAMLQHCVDLHDWFTAAHLCTLEDSHIQALCYRLMGLGEVTSDLSQDSFADLSAKVVSHHLRLALEDVSGATLGEKQLSTLCMQITNHWLDKQLPMAQLEQLLESHLPHLAPHLASLLFRCEGPRKDSSGTNQHYCQHFTSAFCLLVLNTVLSDHSPATRQLLSSWLPQEIHKHDGGKTSCEAGSTPDKALSLQPQSNLIPYQRVWQDIVRSVSKSSSSADCIPLTRSQLDHLHSHSADAEGDKKRSHDAEAGAVVLFTCGHHFSQSAFNNVVLATSLQKLGAGSSDKLPATAALLQQYYGREGLLPLACPKCVLNVLRA